MPSIRATAFNDTTPDFLPTIEYGSDWPVVYIIDNGREAYVGETLDASVRVGQHLQNPERRRLTQISLISDDEFNKSVILDLEAYLIKRMSADGHFELQNGNMGLHVHNYYRRSYYEGQFISIWEMLREKKLADNTLKDIENSDEFKYSPYNSLSADQYATLSSVLANLVDAVVENKNNTAVITGGPGTGKTVLAVHMMKLLNDRFHSEAVLDSEDDEVIAQISESIKKIPENFKIGFVVPMQALRKTLQNVFSRTSGLNENMILSPQDIVRSDVYDLLVVDESHRLKRRKALAQYPAFDEANRTLGLDINEGTELDWILMKSKHQIFFYDSFQSVKPSDVSKARFDSLLSSDNTREYRLRTQFRCKGGDKYLSYIRAVLSNNPHTEEKRFEGYDLRLFTTCGEMTDAITELDNKFGLCRTVAGYSWKWASKKDKKAYDIHIDGRKYRWNSTYTDWVNSPNSVHEIGCIHTIQGYDLNYCAVIFGREIDYDFVSKSFIINRAEYKDNLGRAVGDDETLLRDYVLNIYRTLLTRGISGTFVYACNAGLREYLRQYIPETGSY